MDHHTLIENNRRWVERLTGTDPGFFRRLASEHRPRFLFIGCSDARVPAEVVTGSGPGDLFVHRNVANLVVPTDANLLAVLNYAVDALGVKDVIVCGHEGCGGVKAVLDDSAPLLVEHWLANVRYVARLHAAELDALSGLDERWRRLVELNVREQVLNLSRTPQVQAAWASGKELRIHGWVYGLEQGLIRDLGVTLDGAGSPAAPVGEEAA
jgi:carbonic anhydrase